MRMLTLLVFLLVPQELKFAWPERIEATVETVRTKDQQQGTTSKKSVVRARYRMQVESHPKGRVIRFSQHELLEPKAAGAVAQDVAQVVTSLSPTIVVDAEGALVGIEDVDTLRATLKSLVAPAEKQAAGTGLQPLLQGLTSTEFLQASAAQEWDAVVGNWVGSELNSEIVRFEGATPMPIYPDMEIVLKGTMQMIGKTSCRRGGADVRCAIFEMQSSTDQKSVEAVLQRILKGVKGLEGVRYERFDVRTVVRVTLEIDTMLPHDFSMTKTVTMTASKAGEGRVEGSQVEGRTAKYTYLTPPAGR